VDHIWHRQCRSKEPLSIEYIYLSPKKNAAIALDSQKIQANASIRTMGSDREYLLNGAHRCADLDHVFASF